MIGNLGVVPEKTHTHPMDGHWKFQGGGRGGSQRPKVLKESMKLNWNFWRGGGLQSKNHLWGRYGYFLEPHNVRLQCNRYYVKLT